MYNVRLSMLALHLFMLFISVITRELQLLELLRLYGEAHLKVSNSIAFSMAVDTFMRAR